MKPEDFADNFINKFAPKRVGGAEMRKYLIGRFQRAMEIARKDGYDEGRDQKSKIYLKGVSDGIRKANREKKVDPPPQYIPYPYKIRN